MESNEMPPSFLGENPVEKLIQDVYFGDGPDNPSLTVRMAKTEKEVDDIKHDLYSNGQPGFIARTDKYINEQRGMWKLIVAIGIILTLLESVSTIRSLMRPLNQPTAQHTFLE